jgi:formate hydrogenlyase subunit 3/multisubunit Na+/H+ antiporter MnhD subunit
VMLPWLLSIGLPLVAAGLLLGRRWPRSIGLGIAPLAALPALALAVAAQSDEIVDLPWLLLGTRFGLDPTGRVFLLFTALLWTAAGAYARAYLPDDLSRRRFFLFYLLAMAGNLGLVMVRDVAGFYLFFALMTFSAYALVVYDGSVLAHRAGLVYVAMAVVGEALLLVAFLMATSLTGGNADVAVVATAVAVAPDRDLIVALLLAGFGIKAGAIPLHLWLPLAHPVAPTPASAVLSGAMIKAGLLGWIRFLPVGEIAMPGWATLCLLAGAVAALYGVAVGLTQRDPKTNLAYSSISQMGIMTMALGIGLAEPGAWPQALAAILIYSFHHAFAKGALFLGVGIATSLGDGAWRRNMLMAGLALAAMSLAGAPLTSGAAAKALLKDASPFALGMWPQWLDWLLPLTSIATTLLLGRLLWLIWALTRGEQAHGHGGAGLWVPWLTLLAAVAGAVWIVPTYFALENVDLELIAPADLWVATWPVVAGALLLWSFRYLGRRAGRRTALEVPAGDLVVAVEWGIRGTGALWRGRAAPALTRLVTELGATATRLLDGEPAGRALERLESRLTRWEITGVVFLLLAVVTLGVLAVL